MKGIVILENQIWDRTTLIARIVNGIVKEENCSLNILEHIGDIEPSEIIRTLSQCDTIFFTTTWLYTDSIHSLGKLLSLPQVEPKEIYYQGDDNIAHHLESIFTLEELSKFSKHRFFKVNHSLRNEEDWAEEFDLLQYKIKFEAEEKIRMEKNQGFPKTGRNVRIKNIGAGGKQWSKLKAGDIVPELNCREIDPNPGKGIWVMGYDEPVKLLNSDGYDEWEFSDLKAEALVKEFFCKGNKGDSHETMNILADWIKNCSGKLRLSDGDLWLHCDKICRLIGLERRHNRSYFERRLQEYRAKYVYFREA